MRQVSFLLDEIFLTYYQPFSDHGAIYCYLFAKKIKFHFPDIHFNSGETAGRLRTYQNFQFLQVYNAGHMVPMDKPQAASEMLNSWLEGTLG